MISKFEISKVLTISLKKYRDLLNVRFVTKTQFLSFIVSNKEIHNIVPNFIKKKFVNLKGFLVDFGFF